MPVDLQKVQELIGCVFKDENILKNALAHASAREEILPSNERMEFFGDSIIGMAVSEYLYQTLPQYEEGPLSVIKSVVVSRVSLASIAKEIGLEPHIIIGKGMLQQNAIPDSVLCNVFESVVAAIYLDAGMDKAKEFVLKYLVQKINVVLENKHEKNYKSILQHYSQKKFSVIPVYKVVNETGPDHDKTFEITVRINDRTYGPASGKSKKDAEQASAMAALEALKDELEIVDGKW